MLCVAVYLVNAVRIIVTHCKGQGQGARARVRGSETGQGARELERPKATKITYMARPSWIRYTEINKEMTMRL